ncbi:hypothetical protein V2J09_001712 [Rumex salicifolius]
MLSCHSLTTTSTPSTMLGHQYRTSTFLFHRIRPSKSRPLLFDPVPPKFKVSCSLGNAIAVAASAASSSSVTTAHAAVTSTITQMAVYAVAIASGACLSTKVDFLWPKLEELPSSLILEGVDLTGYPIFNDLKVRKAISFAKKAHHGQSRKTGDPYLTHCIHTGRILAALAPSSGQRAVDTVVAGILHDVIDDTSESVISVREAFGDEVAALVSGVSRLSYINQLLRRRRRVNTSPTSLTQDEANNLRVMLLGMVDDPRVVLIKLADRLHNMRTIYALPSSKAQAVAQETLVIWCSLASRLGLWALKAELEDLCFAVLQPHIFCQMRAELASMWSPSRRTVNHKRLLKDGNLATLDETTPVNGSVAIDEDDGMSMKDLLEAVLPFDLLSDRNKRISSLSNLTNYGNNIEKAKIIRDAGIALASLAVCEEALERELLISTSYVPGMEVILSSRLKSLYSIYSKMKRKDVGISKVYDARALRIVVGDKDGTLHGAAVTCCYSILDLVHRLWAPIDGEFDDYIVNPKPSGYQSLHTAVLGPDSSPLEVQIRTQRMHEYAEHGLAAHWLYKEMGSTSVPARNADGFDTQESNSSKDANEQTSVEDQNLSFKYSFLKAGHPVLRVEGSHLLAAVIISVNKNGKELLVAVRFGLGASEAVAERRTSLKFKRWEAYARLYVKVCNQWWFEPGHGDWSTCLEKYTLCRDGIYHKQDQFDRLLPTYIQVIQLTEKEESEYWTVVSAVYEGGDVDSISSTSEKLTADTVPMTSSKEANINNKVRLLRTMLQWEEQLCSEVGVKGVSCPVKFQSRGNALDFGEVAIVCWPHGDIVRLEVGSTAADAARRVGLEGNLVSVNGHLVLPSTELKDGDVVEVRL